jgi:hypothetical protein
VTIQTQAVVCPECGKFNTKPVTGPPGSHNCIPCNLEFYVRPAAADNVRQLRGGKRDRLVAS